MSTTTTVRTHQHHHRGANRFAPQFKLSLNNTNNGQQQQNCTQQQQTMDVIPMKNLPPKSPATKSNNNGVGHVLGSSNSANNSKSASPVSPSTFPVAALVRAAGAAMASNNNQNPQNNNNQNNNNDDEQQQQISNKQGVFFTCTTTNVPDAVAENFAAVLNNERPPNAPRAIANFAHNSNNNANITLTPVESQNAIVAAAVAQVSTPLTSSTFSSQQQLPSVLQHQQEEKKDSSSEIKQQQTAIVSISSKTSLSCGGQQQQRSRISKKPVFALPSAGSGCPNGTNSGQPTQYELEEQALMQFAGDKNAKKVQQSQQPQIENPSPKSFAAFSPLHNGMTAVSNMSVVSSNSTPLNPQTPAADGDAQQQQQLACRPSNPQSYFEATEIMNSLYLGTTYDADDEQELLKHNIKRVLNVATECNPKVANSTSQEIKVKKIPLKDHSDENIANFFDEALDFIREGIERGEAVLVHCRQGYSRSATFVLAYLMKYGVEGGGSTSHSSSANSRAGSSISFDAPSVAAAAAASGGIPRQPVNTNTNNKDDEKEQDKNKNKKLNDAGLVQPLAVMNPSMARDGDEQQGIWHTATTAIITNPSSFFQQQFLSLQQNPNQQQQQQVTPQTQATPISDGQGLGYPASSSSTMVAPNNTTNTTTTTSDQLLLQQQRTGSSPTTNNTNTNLGSRYGSNINNNNTNRSGANSGSASTNARSPILANPSSLLRSNTTNSNGFSVGNNVKTVVVEELEDSPTTASKKEEKKLNPSSVDQVLKEEQNKQQQGKTCCTSSSSSSQQQQPFVTPGHLADGSFTTTLMNMMHHNQMMNGMGGNQQRHHSSDALSDGGHTTTSSTTGLAMDYEDAFDYVKSRRDRINPNLGFVLALRDLEDRLRHTIIGGGVGSGNSTPRSTPSATSGGAAGAGCFQSTSKMPHEGEMASP